MAPEDEGTEFTAPPCPGDTELEAPSFYLEMERREREERLREDGVRAEALFLAVSKTASRGAGGGDDD